MKNFRLWIATVLLGLWVSLGSAQSERPNILWVTSEDNGQQLGCYGDDYADTPNLDRLAQRSLRYQTCWSNAPVCAPARTTIISGMYATSLGGQHMRSGVRLPDDMQLYPQIFRDAGYYCTNNSKTDYNFDGADAGWHDSSKTASYKNRPSADTPFFAVFNTTVSHESQIRTRPHTLVHDPADAPIPAYHPDTPEVRHDWAQYYDKLTEMDREVGKVLDELDAAGLRDSTIVFYYGDHGSGMPRSKRQPFDSGLRVPLLVSIPDKFRHLAPNDYDAGGETDRLVGFVDLAPTALSLAGIRPPKNMQGVPFAGKFARRAKPYLFGFRGRMDERIDCVRSCTDGRFVYLRHFFPDRPYLKHVEYMFATPTTRIWKERFDLGELDDAQAKFWQPKPVEELFDLQNDPDEVINLANKSQYADRVVRMRNAVANWMTTVADAGLMTEAEMHERSVGQAIRTYTTSDRFPARRLVLLAFSATSESGGISAGQLAAFAQSDDSRIRYWAVRGLALRGAAESLERFLDDENPSVAIAACDGILLCEDVSLQDRAIDRLIDLANVNEVGHFTAIASLNVLDTRANLTAEQKQRIRSLPKRIAEPPVRMGNYVGKLLQHMPL